ncbi:hypothetical protein T03_9401 [Trichinella britovi]|uniref:Uncharacterized protein n=1 Tax=Trichinella britovi TaxID=45882 RepID=A0A0V1DDS3_TRIBR|nr:hypothetical protein T03_9401 [Trichinella britovi]
MFVKKHEKLPGKLITVSYEYGYLRNARRQLIAKGCLLMCFCLMTSLQLVSLFMKQFFDILCTAAAAVKLIEKSGTTL